MQTGSMSHVAVPENKKRRWNIHEIKLTYPQILKRSGVFRHMYTRRKEKSAGLHEVRTSETLRGITVGPLPKALAWISIRHSIIKSSLLRVDINDENQDLNVYNRMMATPPSNSQMSESDLAKSSRKPLYQRGSSSISWTTSGMRTPPWPA